jgi:hypothetical protein
MNTISYKEIIKWKTMRERNKMKPLIMNLKEYLFYLVCLMFLENGWANTFTQSKIWWDRKELISSLWIISKNLWYHKEYKILRSYLEINSWAFYFLSNNKNYLKIKKIVILTSVLWIWFCLKIKIFKRILLNFLRYIYFLGKWLIKCQKIIFIFAVLITNLFYCIAYIIFWLFLLNFQSHLIKCNRIVILPILQNTL